MFQNYNYTFAESMASGLRGTGQWGCPPKICLLKMQFVQKKTFLIIWCCSKGCGNLMWTYTPASRNDWPGRDCWRVPPRNLLQARPAFAMRSFYWGRPGGRHCWRSQKVLESMGQMLVLTGGVWKLNNSVRYSRTAEARATWWPVSKSLCR